MPLAFTVIFAFATAAPEGSLTNPDILPRSDCADNFPGVASIMHSDKRPNATKDTLSFCMSHHPQRDFGNDGTFLIWLASSPWAGLACRASLATTLHTPRLPAWRKSEGNPEQNGLQTVRARTRY